jgi:hypothetical protein
MQSMQNTLISPLAVMLLSVQLITLQQLLRGIGRQGVRCSMTAGDRLLCCMRGDCLAAVSSQQSGP